MGDTFHDMLEDAYKKDEKPAAPAAPKEVREDERRASPRSTQNCSTPAAELPLFRRPVLAAARRLARGCARARAPCAPPRGHLAACRGAELSSGRPCAACSPDPPEAQETPNPPVGEGAAGEPPKEEEGEGKRD